MMVSFTLGRAMAIVMTLDTDKTFYASDYGFPGGTMCGLERNGYIEKTGRTKEYVIPIEMWNGDTLLKKVEVFEWRAVKCENLPDWEKKYRLGEFEYFKDAIISAYEILKEHGHC